VLNLIENWIGVKMVKDFKGVLNGNVSVELGDQVYEVLDSSSNKDKSIN